MWVPGSNSGKFFSTFLCTYIPCGDCSIRVSQSSDFITYIYIKLCSIAFQIIKEHCCDDHPMYTSIFKLFPHLVYPEAVTEV